MWSHFFVSHRTLRLIHERMHILRDVQMNILLAYSNICGQNLHRLQTCSAFQVDGMFFKTARECDLVAGEHLTWTYSQKIPSLRRGCVKVGEPRTVSGCALDHPDIPLLLRFLFLSDRHVLTESPKADERLPWFRFFVDIARRLVSFEVYQDVLWTPRGSDGCL